MYKRQQYTVHGLRRCRAHERVDAPAAARDTAAAAVEQHVTFVVRGEDLREGSLRLVNGKAGGAQPRFLIGIGIADEHALLAAARFQVAAIAGVIQQLAHDLAAALERLDGLKHGSEIERYLARALVVGLGPAREQERRQHVIRARSAAHNEITDSVRAVAMAALHDRIKYRQTSLAERIQFRTRAHVALQRGAQELPPLLARAGTPMRIVESARHHLFCLLYTSRCV